MKDKDKASTVNMVTSDVEHSQQSKTIGMGHARSDFEGHPGMGGRI